MKYFIAFAILPLAMVKVKNELRMTDMYERQAVALERIAKAVERNAALHTAEFIHGKR